MTRRQILLALPVTLAPLPALAQSDPAQVIEGFHATLINLMRQARQLGVRGRYAQLEPVMGRVFDLPAMTRIAVGPPWTGFSPEDQAALTNAFTRWSIATYANRFDGYSGETFQTLGSQAVNNGTLVRTQLNRTGGEGPVLLSYLLRGTPPRVVDIYLTGTISELASRRAEFTSLIREGGATRVTRELEARTDRLLRA
ncbi:ABC transporter substrate-binding protein [Roseococcus suduntuyensis]|uniref:Phospholipid transport system substrate-binding protein n=1 Tax=Roseococcus suduntuyensis TaxID=455361 RepID=A0A840ABX8_9PROT|nr:ABC transporter substrate-binding protein [Roseococcus suduntuyensis]MBB3898402.1 phospholipid transport system substrate-binding protein [Roseococcus suduntuyensis]